MEGGIHVLQPDFLQSSPRITAEELLNPGRELFLGMERKGEALGPPLPFGSLQIRGSEASRPEPFQALTQQTLRVRSRRGKRPEQNGPGIAFGPGSLNGDRGIPGEGAFQEKCQEHMGRPGRGLAIHCGGTRPGGLDAP